MLTWRFVLQFWPMDTIGLLAAWIAILSYLVGIVVTVLATFLARPCQRWWAGTSKKRAGQRLHRLVSEMELYREPADSWYISGLVSLYGTMILTLTAAIGLVVVSIEILDLGPALLASILPFYINAKLITRVTGVLMLAISYFFILRLSYLGVKLRRRYSRNKADDIERTSREISKLQKRFDLPL
jgi:hypothetical protein